MKNNSKKILHLLIFLSYLPVILAFLSLLSGLRLTIADTFWALGLMAGLTGFIILWWQYLLGIRFIATLFTEDLLWINNLHKNFGKYGFLIIFLHPFIIYLDRILSGFGLTFPSLASEYDRAVLLGQVSFAIIGVIWLTSAAFRKRISYRLWKRIHFITYPILFLVFIHSTTVGFFLNDNSIPLLRLYWYLLFVLFILFTLYRLFKQLLLKSNYQISSIKQETYDTFSIEISYKSGKQIVPKIGQFIYVQLSRFGENHPYTVSKFDKQSGNLTITTKLLGKFSKELINSKIGQAVYLDGPYGVFTRELPREKLLSTNIILIAGGIGITPFLRFVEEMRVNKSEDSFDKKITLFYGNKTLEDIAFKDYLDSLDKSIFQIVHVLSNMDVVPKGYERGFITEDLLRKYINNMSENTYFLCGPPVMLNKLIPMLNKMGIARGKVFYERFDL